MTRWLRRLPAGVVVLALLVLVVRNADGPALPDYSVPDGFVPAPPPTTALPGAVRPDLAPVEGTTTSVVPANIGRARLTGVVIGPAGAAVVGAVVRIERVVFGASQVIDAVTGADGRYDAPGIGGGRYRVRAFLAPTLAQPRGTVLFLPDGEERSIDLTVEAFAEPAIALAVAPNPPFVGDAVNMAIRVTGRLVDPDGFVRTQGFAGGTVTVSATGGWAPRGSTVGSTDGGGDVRFAFDCRSTAPALATITVRLPVPVTTQAPDPTAPPGSDSTPAAPVSTTTTFELPTCVDPTTLTTTTLPGESTTSTSDPGASTATSTPESTTTTVPPTDGT